MEHSFDLPWPKNAGSNPKRKPVQTRHPKRTTVKTTRKATAEPRPKQDSALVPAKEEDRSRYERQRSQTPQRREQQRRHAQAKRQQAKEQSLCRDCGDPALPQQTRSETCADRHRVSRRKRQARQKAGPNGTIATVPRMTGRKRLTAAVTSPTGNKPREIPVRTLQEPVGDSQKLFMSGGKLRRPQPSLPGHTGPADHHQGEQQAGDGEVIHSVFPSANLGPESA